MTNLTLRDDARALHITFDTGESATFPALFLRDNCPSGFHPQTLEREFDLTSVEPDIAITEARLDGADVLLSWSSGDATSCFSLTWLSANAPGRAFADAAAVAPTLWHGDMTKEQLPTAAASNLLSSDAALQSFLTETKRTGLAIVNGMADDADAGMTVARRIGFLRETNFGITFEVMSKPDPNNLAYTSHALPLHTDLPNQELAPGFQFLHCLANEAEGGGSTFADGFAIAAGLKEHDPEAFDLLASEPIPFRFQDGDYDIRKHHTVIQLDHTGTVSELRFNAHIASVFDMDASKMDAYYRAYRNLMQMTRDPKYVMTMKLNGGEMVIFDNRRALHGRAAFDPSTGFRHLRGCYVDRGEFDSRIRVLSRGQTAAQAA
ncbi:gamma-butyrobetaine dioxygenase [Roseibium sp. TrichSKD4]|uniref:TauD/TfdA family dioxygenase n=1 Tax=Roseibium sp. TrichSKD4 TaxID=744980 RepID=UPI0001E56B6C|nr:TauD/TfdA family dioxygenase [Roseibium sp. TrichSKD4]EFO30706.1 gamma-butyrobetaine dioxygenase [Roseibium sp. TrichSKD4]